MTEQLLSQDPIQHELIKRLNYFDNWKDRYKYLIDMGKQLQAMPDDFKTASTSVNRKSGFTLLNKKANCFFKPPAMPPP